MGSRGEIYSKKYSTNYGQRTYFFNLKENRMGDVFLSIVESIKPAQSGGPYQRTQIAIFDCDWKAFLKGLDDLKNVIKERKYPFESIVETHSGKRLYRYKLIEKNRSSYAIIKEEKPEATGDEKLYVRINAEDFEAFLQHVKETIAYQKE